MHVRVISWNMAGAKLPGRLAPPPHPVASRYIDAYSSVWTEQILPHLTVPPNEPEYPDIILLQECIGFTDHSDLPSGRWQSGRQILESIFTNYRAFFFPSVTSHEHPHPAKWEKYREGSGIKNFLPQYVDAQQGYGVCVLDPAKLRKLWIPSAAPSDASIGADVPEGDGSFHLCFERTHITTGAYLGDRDTEPRLAIMGRTFQESPNNNGRYINFLNVHLTTLKGERSGNVRINRRASRIRIQQIGLILENVMSAYQEAEKYRVSRRTADRGEDVWIIGGDFNATPDSEELTIVRRAGFVDGTPDKKLVDANNSSLDNQFGTKWSLKNPDQPASLLDYIFCGLELTTFPVGGVRTTHSRRPFRPMFADEHHDFETDHAMLFCSFDL